MCALTLLAGSRQRILRSLPWTCVLALAALLVIISALQAAERVPRKIAFLVGVAKYDHDFGNLDYAELDVTALAQELKAAGYEVVILLGSGTGKDRATGNNIAARLKGLLDGEDEKGKVDEARKVRKGDLLLLALSGHGQELELNDPMHPEQQRQDNFFAPVDGKKGNPATLVSLSYLLDKVLQPSGATNLLLVDACRDVYDPNKGKGINGKKINLQDGTGVLFSCAVGQQSWESQNVKHGVFTYAVLQRLRSASENNESLSWARLVSDVQDKMKSEEYGKLIPKSKTQTPVYAGGQLPNTTILAAGSSKKVPAALMAPFTNSEAKAAQTAWARHLGKKVLEEIDLGAGGKLELVLIPPGTYQMGSPAAEDGHQEDEQQHLVTITKPFYLGKYAVTQEQYLALAGENPSYFQREGGGAKQVTGLNTGRFPVEMVSWAAANAFCVKAQQNAKWGKLGLPSEAQWEYACRAGTATPFSCGVKLTSKEANCDAGPGSLKRTCAVGSFTPNGFGLYDMHGNVWEWCADVYQEYGAQPQRDPLQRNPNPKNLRVLRGGSWESEPLNCRSAFRQQLGEDARPNQAWLGLRVCVAVD